MQEGTKLTLAFLISLVVIGLVISILIIFDDDQPCKAAKVHTDSGRQIECIRLVTDNGRCKGITLEATRIQRQRYRRVCMAKRQRLKATRTRQLLSRRMRRDRCVQALGQALTLHFMGLTALTLQIGGWFATRATTKLAPYLHALGLTILIYVAISALALSLLWHILPAPPAPAPTYDAVWDEIPVGADDANALFGSLLRGGGEPAGGGRGARHRKNNEDALRQALLDVLKAFDNGGGRTSAKPPPTPRPKAEQSSRAKRRKAKRAENTGGLVGALHKVLERHQDGRDLVGSIKRILEADASGKLHPGQGTSGSETPRRGTAKPAKSHPHQPKVNSAAGPPVGKGKGHGKKNRAKVLNPGRMWPGTLHRQMCLRTSRLHIGQVL